MNLSCPSCNQKANTRTPEFFKDAIIECSACGTHYHIEGHVVNPSDRSYKQISQAPKGMQIQSHINSKVITIDSSIQKSRGVAVFTLLIGGIMIWNFLPLVDIFTLGLHLIPIALFIILGILQVLSMLRKRIIHISPMELKITHSLPGIFLKDKIFLLKDFTQFYTKKIVTKHDESTIIRYALHGILKNGAGEASLIGGFSEADQVYFLEREVEIMLDIRDQKVEQEYDSRGSIKMTFGKAFQLIKAVMKNNKE